MTRTLIVFLHGIGDNIMFTGVIKEYCRLRPEEKIDLVVLNPGCAAIWRGNPRINKVIVYNDSQPYFWNPLRFYFVHRWKVVRYIAGLNGDHPYDRVWFLTIQTLPEIIYHVTGTYGRHKVDRIAQNVEVPPQLYPYDIYTTPEDAAAADEVLRKYGSAPVAILHPFSGHTRKRLSAEGMREIIRVLHGRGLTPVLVGANSERSQIHSSWQTDAAMGLPLGVLVEVLKRAKVFVGTDSSVAHLAAFANTPQIIIFSPKLKPSRYLPLSERSRILTIPIRQGHEVRSLQDFRSGLDPIPVNS